MLAANVFNDLQNDINKGFEFNQYYEGYVLKVSNAEIKVLYSKKECLDYIKDCADRYHNKIR